MISGEQHYTAAGFARAGDIFLVNSLGRLWGLYTVPDSEIDNIVFYAESDSASTLRGNFAEFFEILSLSDKIRIISGPTSFEHLIVPPIGLEIGVTLSDEFLLPFKEARKRVMTDVIETVSHAPVFLSRSKWNGNDRMQINIGLVDQIFSDNGYEIVYPETISLRKLITIMNQAPSIATFNGSTAHNLLFCKPTKPVIIERCAACNKYQLAINIIAGHKATCVDAFFQPLLTSSTDNLTIYGLTDYLRDFIEDYKFKLSSGKGFRSNPRREFKSYLRIFKRHYGYGYGLNEWEADQLQAISEAYFDSYRRYAPYIEQRDFLFLSDYLSPRI